MWYPKRPENLEDAKLRNYYIQDNILRILHVRSTCRGMEIAEILKVPFSLIDDELRHLREVGSIVPISGNGIGGYEGMDFSLTQVGRELATELFSISSFVGPAAVDIEDYFESVKKQRIPARSVRKMHLDAAFHDIVVSQNNIDELGPALNSGGPIFLYGKPGNGKTTIAERLARIFRQGIFVPYAILIDNQVIQIFDEKIHVPVPENQLPQDHPARADPRSVDSRWVYVYRPFIVVGGELTLQMLDLIYQNGQHIYEAPFQLKANGGILLVDDFGRQIVKPKDFLNRWIYPLEKGVDFLTLITGKKIQVPFDQILIFSTNINPGELADEAFWRRIRYKIGISNPTEAEFTSIFKSVCQKEKILFDEQSFRKMVKDYYTATSREFRAVHARDILGHVKDQISYHNLEPKLTSAVLETACNLYFGGVETHTTKPWAA